MEHLHEIGGCFYHISKYSAEKNLIKLYFLKTTYLSHYAFNPLVNDILIRDDDFLIRVEVSLSKRWLGFHDTGQGKFPIGTEDNTDALSKKWVILGS